MYDLRYYNPKMAGNISINRHSCGKPTCRCAKSRKYHHSSYRLQWKKRIDGKWRRKREYVPKPKVRALRQRIRRAKAKDKQRKQQYLHVISEMSRIISKLDNNAFDDGVWQSLNQLRTEIPSPAKLIVTFQQQITMMKYFAQLTIFCPTDECDSTVSELCIRRAGKN